MKASRQATRISTQRTLRRDEARRERGAALVLRDASAQIFAKRIRAARPDHLGQERARKPKRASSPASGAGEQRLELAVCGEAIAQHATSGGRQRT